MTEGLKKWAAQAVEALRTQAGHTLRPLDEVFVREIQTSAMGQTRVWDTRASGASSWSSRRKRGSGGRARCQGRI